MAQSAGEHANMLETRQARLFRNVRQLAHNYLARHFEGGRYVNENGWLRPPEPEHNAARFILEKRLECQTPDAIAAINPKDYGELQRFADGIVQDVIQNYPRYAEEYRSDAIRHDVPIPDEIPKLHYFEIPYGQLSATSLVDGYNHQVNRLKKHLDQLTRRAEKENDADKLSQIHDQYTHHLYFVAQALTFLERSRAPFLKTLKANDIKEKEIAEKGKYAAFKFINNFKLVEQPSDYPPLGRRIPWQKPEFHALLDLEALELRESPWKFTPENIEMLYTHRQRTLEQQRLALESFLRTINERRLDLKDSRLPRARATQKLRKR